MINFSYPSLPFEARANNTVAVKIVDDQGLESLKIMKLTAPIGPT